MTRYRKKDPMPLMFPLMFPVSNPVDAFMFEPRHRVIPAYVHERRVGHVVQTIYGPRDLLGGDWILISGDRPLAVMSDHLFKQTYEPINGTA